MHPIRLKPTRVRRLLIALTVTGVFLAVVAPRLGWPLAAIAGIWLFIGETRRLERAVMNAKNELYSLVQIRPLVTCPPVELGGWAAEALFLEKAVGLIVKSRPGLIVECGSGSSTVVLARCLQAVGGGRVVALEHDPDFARETVQLLRLHGVDAIATCVTAPLVERRTQEGRTLRWYAAEYEPFLTQPIDLLVVDGPPRGSGPLARYPAVTLLRSYLSRKCIILLDDGDRPDERAVARLWADELEAPLTYLSGGRGGWLLRRS